MHAEADFNGLLFAGREKCPVRFAVTRLGTLEFSADGLGEFNLALPSAELSLIGDPPVTLQISWPEGGERYALLCAEPALFERLSALSLPPATQSTIAALQKQQRQNQRREQGRVPIYLALIVGFLSGGYLLFHYSAPAVANLIPFEWEQKIGEFALENYQIGKKSVEDAQVNDAVNAIVARIDRFDGANIDYRVTVVDTEAINAFAFPGGYVVVTTGLIENADNPEQVAGVLAHELTHVLERHGMRKLVRQAGLGVLLGIVFGDVSALSRLVELAAQLDSLSFDRDQERAADDGAIKIMTEAGLSPRHLAAFFETLRQQDSLSGSIPELLQTHPLTDERIKRVSAAAEPERVFQFELDWQNVRQRVAAVKRQAQVE